jgi:transcriptional regulator with PAS, ATPase and Fis domain
MVCVNVAGIDDDVFSDSLFGHVHGAFTGADRFRKGLLEEAAHGTIFLDEIGELSPGSQIKLLRLLQDGKYRPVGSDSELTSSARFVYATNRDLKSMMHAGKFRADLYYRLQAHEICIPPLRERLDDLSLLAQAFVDQACTILRKPAPLLNAELITLLSTYSWPGNVRELRGLLLDAVSRNSSASLSLMYLKEKFRTLRLNSSPSESAHYNTETNADLPNFTIKFSTMLPTAEQMELLLIKEALRRTNGNKSQAADLLGLTRATIINRLKTSPQPS